MAVPINVQDVLQELWELGLRDSVYRVGREVRLRLGLEAMLDRQMPSPEATFGRVRFDDDDTMGAWAPRLPFASPQEMASLRERIPAPHLEELRTNARGAMRGRIQCFGRWTADFGHPIDWHLDPATGRHWASGHHWSAIAKELGTAGDVKRTWEVARFPQAYVLARAATFDLCPTEALAKSLDQQVRSFVSNNPHPRGVHWASGQEVAFRLMALVFSVGTMARLQPDSPLPAFLARQSFAMGCHIEAEIEFAKRAIYNNHLLSEALGLLLAAWLLPVCDTTARWERIGLDVLTEQADRQIYRDGAYIQQSHNYHRVAMQNYLWACCVRRADGRRTPQPWLRAMERSLEFLLAHQNETDGRLPNYGANDGAMPFPVSTCDFSDFRPVLQALSVVTRGERLYGPGPWDELGAWVLGPAVLDQAPVRARASRSVAFRDTGYVVLRGQGAGNFGAFRCGSIRDRFSQIDMLHLDVWWGGYNVLVDPGSYVYNGAAEWHSHFLRTESHNTVKVDGFDQMLHFRQFKCLYWTPAEIVAFEDKGAFVLCTGAHGGFRRHPGRCVHQRSVLFVKDDLWVVVDRVLGTGHHDLRLQWLGGEFPFAYDPRAGRMTLETPAGAFSVSVFDERGNVLLGDVVAGQDSPPRGWSSRYYGERVAVPSLVVERSGAVPIDTVSVLAAGIPDVRRMGARWSVRLGAAHYEFAIDDGAIRSLTLGNR